MDGPGSAPTPPGWELAGLGLAAGLLLAGIAALIGRALRRKKVPARSPSGQVAVEKLHEQGARKSQQDSFFVSAGQERMPGDVIRTGPGLLAVVADGMGGLADGDKVSQAAVSAIANGFYQTQGGPEEVLLSLLEQANRAVNTLLGPEGLRRSGSTLAAGLFREGAFYYLSVGDSRICLFRDGALYQLNREHVYRNELYTDAVNGLYSLSEAERHPKGGGLTSYLGMGEVKYVDLPAQPVAVREGDVFLLMSDGVYNALAEEELKAALSAPGSAADALRGAIQAKGYANQDNYTAVILRCCPGRRFSMIQTASYTDPGGRPGNEDTVRQAAREGGRLCVLVADGLGGHGGGAQASATRGVGQDQTKTTRSNNNNKHTP